MAHFRKLPHRCKISRRYRRWRQAELLPILSWISLLWQRGRSGTNAIGSIRWPIPENPL